MKKSNKILFVSVASIGFIASAIPAIFNPDKAVAQSQFGCYMIDEIGQRIDLSKICDASKRNRANRPPKEVNKDASQNEANVVNHIPIQVNNDGLTRRYRRGRRRTYSSGITGISPFPYRVLPDLGPVNHRFIGALSPTYPYSQNRILGPISDPYFSSSPPIIYRYIK